MDLLKAVDLIKKFDTLAAVDGASFSIQKGEIFGFLGPNGAGKTTTINLLTGLAKVTSGSLFLEGVEYTKRIKKAQELMGIVPDESNLYDELNGFENLCFCASLYGLDRQQREQRAKTLLTQFGLDTAQAKSFKTYSKGMKRKLTIAAGIIHQPKILFLDEPTTGIDVMSARQIRRLITDLNRKGTTIFMTTHYIEEAERLCHRIAFIVNGKIKRIGTLEELMKEAQQEHIVHFQVEKYDSHLMQALMSAFPDYRIQSRGNNVLSCASKDSIDLLPFITFLSERQIAVHEAKLIHPTLEDIFVKVTGIGAKVMKMEKEAKRK